MKLFMTFTLFLILTGVGNTHAAEYTAYEVPKGWAENKERTEEDRPLFKKIITNTFNLIFQNPEMDTFYKQLRLKIEDCAAQIVSKSNRSKDLFMDLTSIASCAFKPGDGGVQHLAIFSSLKKGIQYLTDIAPPDDRTTIIYSHSDRGLAFLDSSERVAKIYEMMEPETPTRAFYTNLFYLQNKEDNEVYFIVLSLFSNQKRNFYSFFKSKTYPLNEYRINTGPSTEPNSISISLDQMDSIIASLEPDLNRNAFLDSDPETQFRSIFLNLKDEDEFNPETTPTLLETTAMVAKRQTSLYTLNRKIELLKEEIEIINTQQTLLKTVIAGTTLFGAWFTFKKWKDTKLELKRIAKTIKRIKPITEQWRGNQNPTRSFQPSQKPKSGKVVPMAGEGSAMAGAGSGIVGLFNRANPNDALAQDAAANLFSGIGVDSPTVSMTEVGHVPPHLISELIRIAEFTENLIDTEMTRQGIISPAGFSTNRGVILSTLQEQIRQSLLFLRLLDGKDVDLTPTSRTALREHLERIKNTLKIFHLLTALFAQQEQLPGSAGPIMTIPLPSTFTTTSSLATLYSLVSRRTITDIESTLEKLITKKGFRDRYVETMELFKELLINDRYPTGTKSALHGLLLLSHEIEKL